MNEYAQMVHLKAKNSKALYSKDMKWATRALNKMLQNDDDMSMLTESYQIHVNLERSLGNNQKLTALIGSFMLVTVSVMIVGAFVMSQQLIEANL